MSVKKVPFVLKDSYLQVTVDGKPYALDSSHPTFARLRKAIKAKRWNQIPKLVSLAKSITFDTEGSASIIKGVVYYKGKPVESSLTERIVQMVRRGKEVKLLLRFMNNLYQNPSTTAVSQFYDWLKNNDLPITDNGCFIAYKSVRDDYTDTHSGTVNNRPGQVIMMSRRVCDSDYNTQCATGFHVCSKQYGIYGNRVMAVMINPKHVLSAVSGKMRVTQYEVLKELGHKYQDNLETIFTQKGIASIEGQLVIEVKKERQEMIKLLLNSKVIKKLLNKKLISKTSITKANYARLKSMVQKYDFVPKVGPEVKHYLKSARLASGLTRGQVAQQMKIGYKAVATLEAEESPSQNRVDSYLEAIAKLTHSSYGISYPKPVKAYAQA